MRGMASKVRSKNSLWNNVVLWWRLDEASGNALDSSGNNYQGTVNSATQNITGHIRQAVSFDGVNDYIYSVNTSLAAEIQGLTDFSISFWANALSYEKGAAIGMGLETQNDVLAIYPYFDAGKAGDQIHVWWNNQDIIAEDSTLLADGTWNNFIFRTQNGNDHELLVNGTSFATSALSKSMDPDSDIFNVGSYDTNEEYYEGGVDHVQLWDKYLTDDEVEWLQYY